MLQFRENRRDCGTWDYHVLIRAGILEWRITIIAYRIFEQDDSVCFITSEHDGVFI